MSEFTIVLLEKMGDSHKNIILCSFKNIRIREDGVLNKAKFNQIKIVSIVLYQVIFLFIIFVGCLDLPHEGLDEKEYWAKMFSLTLKTLGV